MASKRKTKYSFQEMKAYWIGVGISSAVHKEHESLLNSKNPKIRTSIRKGYRDDNYKDVSKKYR